MKVYHYTWVDNWRKQFFNSEARNRGVLTPGVSIHGIKGVFALLEPIPQEWVENQDFPDAWDALRGHVGKLLLEIDLNGFNHEGFVVDYGLIRRVHPDSEDAIREYKRSKVPLGEFVEKRGTLNYQLPEVVIPKPIGRNRIQISTQQPLLELMLEEHERMGADVPRSLSRLKVLPGIEPWYSSYLELHPEFLDNSRREQNGYRSRL